MVMSMDSMANDQVMGSPMEESGLLSLSHNRESLEDEEESASQTIGLQSKASGQTVVAADNKREQIIIGAESHSMGKNQAENKQQEESAMVLSREQSFRDEDYDDEQVNAGTELFEDRKLMMRVDEHQHQVAADRFDATKDPLVARMRDIVEGNPIEDQSVMMQTQTSSSQQQMKGSSGDSLNQQATENNSKASIDSAQQSQQQKRSRQPTRHQHCQSRHHHHHHHHHHSHGGHHRPSLTGAGGQSSNRQQQTGNSQVAVAASGHQHHRHHHHHHGHGQHSHQLELAAGSGHKRSSSSQRQSSEHQQQASSTGELKSSEESLSSSVTTGGVTEAIGSQQQRHRRSSSEPADADHRLSTPGGQQVGGGQEANSERCMHHHGHHHLHHHHGRHHHHRNHKKRLVQDSGPDSSQQQVEAAGGEQSREQRAPLQEIGSSSSNQNYCPYHEHHCQSRSSAARHHSHSHHHLGPHHSHSHSHGHHHSHHHHAAHQQQPQTGGSSSSGAATTTVEPVASGKHEVSPGGESQRGASHHHHHHGHRHHHHHHGHGHHHSHSHHQSRQLAAAHGRQRHKTQHNSNSNKSSSSQTNLMMQSTGDEQLQPAAGNRQVDHEARIEAKLSSGPADKDDEDDNNRINRQNEDLGVQMDSVEEQATDKRLDKGLVLNSGSNNEVVNMEMSPNGESRPTTAANGDNSRQQLIQESATEISNNILTSIEIIGQLNANEKQTNKLSSSMMIQNNNNENNNDENNDPKSNQNQKVEDSDHKASGNNDDSGGKRDSTPASSGKFSRSDEGSFKNQKAGNQLVRQMSSLRDNAQRNDSGGRQQEVIEFSAILPDNFQQQNQQTASQPKQIVESTVSPDRRCRLCWCCCCPCSGLSAKSNTSKGEMVAKSSTTEPPSSGNTCPSTNIPLERIRSWSESFDRLMKCPDGRRIFQDFLRCEYSEENILFWIACEELKLEKDIKSIENKARDIYEDYISILSAKEVSLDSRVRDVINNNIKKPTSNIFDEAQLQIYTLMHRDSYPRFINSPMYKKLAQISNTSRKSST